MIVMKSSVHPTCKTHYRVGNWRAYERALVRRGDVTLWLSPGAMAAWAAPPSGRQPRFSDLAIETALTLRLVFRLPLRQTASTRPPRPDSRLERVPTS
ncbi:MAG: transposase [Acidobacteria bacterium]|nr:transposase [Acidobacteriota bacterium]